MAYKIYGTNEPYSGKVIQIGNRLYTTKGGALEGNSYELVEDKKDTGKYGNELAKMNNTNNTTRSSNSNPIIETFNAPQTPRYYKPNGTLVRIGSPLHRHQDGTIMTEHSMGLNDNSVIVTTTNPGRAGNDTGPSSVIGTGTPPPPGEGVTPPGGRRTSGQGGGY